MPLAPVETDLHDAILDAMERLLARFGYKKTTMDDLAREVDIGKGTIYLHFPSKEEVALQSIDRVVDRVHAQLKTIAGSDASVAERLERMLVQRVLQRFDSVSAYSQSLDDLFESLRPAYMSRRQRYFELEADLFTEVLLEGRGQKVFDVADPRATAYTLLLATNSLLPYSLSTRELGKRGEIKVRVEAIARLLLHGLLVRP
jgi:AcrR family transcriptional regulator